MQIYLAFADVPGNVRDDMKRTRLTDEIGKNNIIKAVNEAVAFDYLDPNHFIIIILI